MDIPNPPYGQNVRRNFPKEWIILIVLFVAIAALIAIYVINVVFQPKNNDNGKNVVSNIKTEELGDGVSKNVQEILSGQEQLKRFSTQKDLKTFLEENPASTTYYPKAMGLGSASRDTRMLAEPLQAPDSLDLWGGQPESVTSANGLGATNESTPDYSTTNVQVEGVDEADIVKSDGKYIYVVSDKNLYIVESYPAENAKILSTLTLDSFIKDIYIQENRLIAFGFDDGIYNKPYYEGFRRHSAYTFFKVYDTTNKSEPKLAKDLKFEGSYFNSRMIGDHVYFITNNYNYGFYDNEPVLPRIMQGDEVVSQGDTFPEVFYFDIPYRSYNFTTIAAVNVKDLDAKLNKQFFLFDSSQQLFASKDNIYITYTKYIPEEVLAFEVLKEMFYDKFSERDKKVFDEIVNQPNYILSMDEKMAKLEYIFEKYYYNLPYEEQEKLDKDLENKMKQKYEDIAKELEKTIIHKIAINKGALVYSASGSVPGHVLNQFSMDEHNKYFRIATTTGRVWSQFIEADERESKNNMYVLDEKLNIVGTLEDLAPGEQIYSTRFMGNRAYMVTFKQIDPFFVIDLADPQSPKVLGELKIPGFSQYLHPYDETTIIGLGHDTKENEFGGVVTQGVKISMFDVTNVSEPREIDTEILGGRGSSSEAITDHKAFLFDKDKQLLSLPMTLRNVDDQGFWGDVTFDGAVIFSVTKDGFEERGRISHSDGLEKLKGRYIYDASVRRTLYIDNVLYTLSRRMLKMNNIGNLEYINRVEFPDQKYNEPIYPEPMPLIDGPELELWGGEDSAVSD